MDRETFILIGNAAYYAESFLKLEPECWLNRLRKPIHIVVAVKGHHVRPNLPGRPTLRAQSVFSHYHRKRHQEEHPYTEQSPEFRSLVAKWGAIHISKPVEPMRVRSHQPKKKIDLASVFSVGATGGKPDENSMAESLFRRVMVIFLSEFEMEYRGEYNMEKVRSFSEKMSTRLSRVKHIKAPDLKAQKRAKVTIINPK